MTIIDEKARRKSVERALRMVRTGAMVERSKLFMDMPKEPGAREFQRKTLKKLVDLKAVRRTSKPGEKGSFYIVDQIDVIDEILKSEDSLIYFIWPSANPDEVDQVSFPPTPSQEQESAEVPIPALAPPSEGGAAVELDPKTIEVTNMLLKELILTMNAVLQSAIFTRDTVDALRKELQEMNKQATARDEKLNFIVRELGGT